MSDAPNIPSNALDVYKRIIDDLVNVEPVSARLVREEGLYNRGLGAETQNDFVRALSEDQRKTLAEMLANVHQQGIGHVLAYLEWWITCHELAITFRGEQLPTGFAEGILYDWIGRGDGWEWPSDPWNERVRGGAAHASRDWVVRRSGMAIEYSIVLDTTEKPAEVAAWLASTCRLDLIKTDPVPTLTGDGTILYVLDQSATGRELIREAFDIESTITISVCIDKFDRMQVGMDGLIAICQAILRDRSDDMVMLANGEKGLALRRSGHISFDGTETYWRDRWAHVCTKLEIPFVSTRLHSL